MRIILDNIPTEQAQAVLAQMKELGYSAHSDYDIDLDEVEESHIQLILQRRQDPELSKTKSLEEVFAKYESRRRS